ncbi:MAG: cation:proton antiporter [Helicobacteraceae bacterium]|jgi:NhaP-type Na+/H+ or K+/H+ antiporter|nr:cation:proton antiporter [Helicobacteraceae bacterium]
MLEIFSIVLTLILIAKYLEDTIKVPFILIIIILAYTTNNFFDLSLLGDNFEAIMYMMLPVILIPDILGLSRSELQDNFTDIIYLAVVAVLISIALAVGFTYFVENWYKLSLFELLILFTPLMATDVVSVSAIFSKFRLPQKLKLYAEGESLFNDITAMIIFFFIAIPFMTGESPSALTLLYMTLYTILISIIVGVVVGLLGYYSFKFSRDNFSQFISIYVMASLAFLIADYVDLSGILAVVISILLFKYLFDKEGHYNHKNYGAIFKYLNSPSSNDLSFRAYRKESYFLALFANALIFISIADVIKIDLFFQYQNEILYTFALTTVIRYTVVLILVKYRGLSMQWNNVLTLSGMKGGLAIIMIVSLSDSFMHKEMFMAIILGVVILSIFVYTIVLMIYLHFASDALLMDTAIEHHLDIKDIRGLLAKEQDTGAYNEVVFESFVEKEISRAERHNSIFSIIAFHSDKKTLKRLESLHLRASDYFGKIDKETYAILLAHTNIEDSVIFADKLSRLINHKHIAISQYMPGDSIELMYDKLYVAIKDKKRIDIEV